LPVTEPLIAVAGRDDAKALADLWTEAFTTGHPEGASGPYSTADFDDTVDVANVLVARAGDEIVGTVSLFDSDHEGINREGEAELGRLAVARRARGKGIGRALLERAHELAAGRGNRAIVLWSGPHQVEGHRLYESLGYVRAPDRDEMGEDGRKRLVFIRPLTG
jgi:predicted N-acetyltransferase YhbS